MHQSWFILGVSRRFGRFIYPSSVILGNPRAEGLFDLVKLSKLGLREGRDAVLRHQDAQFGASVDAPLIGPGFYQSVFAVSVLNELPQI
jgi:hypothetical protein